jgi:hypothetical protein
LLKNFFILNTLAVIKISLVMGFNFACTVFMDDNYQQLDLQSLLDLLAEETEKHTKAFKSGDSAETVNSRTKVNALIAEIYQRKGLLNRDKTVESSPDSTTDAAPSTM